MRYLLILPIVLISLCANLPIQLPTFPQPQIQQAGVFTIDVGSPDVFINIQAVPPEVKSGRYVQMIFELRNKHSYDLENVVLTVYDHPCFTEGNFTSDEYTIKANRSVSWTWKWKAETDLTKQCLIRFRTKYDGEYFFSQDIAVLPESEYQLRSTQGTLKDVPIQSFSSDSPLSVSLIFSEEQPFLENQKGYYMYINYYNKGEGFFDTINLNITTPSNIGNLNCADYVSIGADVLSLNKKLTFIRNKATPTTCSFDTLSATAMNIKSLSITASYKYVLDNSISITVKA